MDWDPEIHDPTQLPRPTGEDAAGSQAEPPAGPSEPSSEPPPIDLFAPIDPNAPVSGHRPAPAGGRPISESPEQDWDAAKASIFPLLRDVGTTGLSVAEFDPAATADSGARAHTQPLVDEGPAGLPVVYAMRSGAFDVIVNGDHLLTWGIGVIELQDVALANLAAWSATAAWTDETSDDRRLLSSISGEGWDASRILLREVAEYLARELGGRGRIIIGIPDRHTLAASAIGPADMDFLPMFEDFVRETAGAADEPIDRRVFELVGGRLVPFVP
jgi:hypothetical protein